MTVNVNETGKIPHPAGCGIAALADFGNATLGSIHARTPQRRARANPYPDHVEPPDRGGRRAGAGHDPHGIFSTSVREAGDLSAGVFDRHGRMLAQAVTGTPGHVNSMANGVKYFLDVYPIDDHEARRPLHHQRSVAHLRPSARHHRGDAELLSRRSGRPVRQHHPCRRYRRPRHGARRPAGVRGRPGDPDHAARPRRPHERGFAAPGARQCARAAAGRGRHLRLRRVQRRRQPAAHRDDGRVRDRQSRPARRQHPRSLARGDARPHPQAAEGHLPQQHDDGRLRQAAHCSMPR